MTDFRPEEQSATPPIRVNEIFILSTGREARLPRPYPITGHRRDTDREN